MHCCTSYWSVATENIAMLLAVKGPDDDEDDPPPTPPSAPPPAPSQPIPLAAAVPNARSSNIPAYKKIKLHDLFNYPSADQLATDFEFYWHIGVDGLNTEEEGLGEEQGADADAVVHAEPMSGGLG
ncbi:hypothetical protein R3P38DRAFT_3181581 [Favolaschia claudopus]|uniref:Uncharacterized protein n=1 Tax=Favolaschia claudopus TaxID=2862362 RepID=A0AAW0CNI1_9AGAR